MLSLTSQSGVFEGPADNLVFSHSVKLLRENMYRTAGRLLALSLTQGGPGLHCLSQASYRSLFGMPVSDEMLSVELVADVDMRTQIQAVSGTTFVHFIAL